MPINKSSYYPKTLVWLASLLSAWKSTAHNFYKEAQTERNRKAGKSNIIKQKKDSSQEGKTAQTDQLHRVHVFVTSSPNQTMRPHSGDTWTRSNTQRPARTRARAQTLAALCCRRLYIQSVNLQNGKRLTGDRATAKDEHAQLYPAKAVTGTHARAPCKRKQINK